MPEFGALAPFGLLEFGSQESDAERVYQSQIDAVRGAFDTSEGTHVEASAYARALSIAAARATMRHGRDQKHARKAVEMLPALERKYKTVVVHGQSEEDRRKVVAARMLLSRGNRRESIESALTALLGDDFVALRTLGPLEQERWPTDPIEYGAFEEPARVQRVFRLTQHVAVTGSLVTFGYEHLAGDDGTRILKGETYCFGQENPGLAESATIDAANTTAKTATVSFQRPKDAGSTINSYAPIVTNIQRTLLIVLTTAASRNAVVRRQVNDLLSRMARSVTRWFIVDETTPLKVGPFVVGLSPIGSTALGSAATPY